MKFIYICNSCSRNYIEVRQETDPQWVTECECGGAFIAIEEK